MKMFKHFLTAMMTAGFATILISCAPEACFEETNAYLKASFYSFSNSTVKLIAPDSLTVFGQGKTTRLYNKTGNVQPALLPLNAADDSCTFIIRINGINDTVRFVYSSRTHLLSKECGYTYYHTLLDLPAYTQNNIDTILIINSSITTANEENIRIFY